MDTEQNQCSWRPSCSMDMLHLRAHLFSRIRAYFQEQQVLEVETPVLSRTIGTDPNLQFFSSRYDFAGGDQLLYMQTSPEFAMKRLLAAGSGSIFQISKAFRNGETGRLHNPEFTLLEWYRVTYDLSALIEDVRQLLTGVFEGFLTLSDTCIVSYSDLFFQATGLHALEFDVKSYAELANAAGLPDAERLCGEQRALWLDFLFSHLVQPAMEQSVLYFVHDYPACLPSLARNSEHHPGVVERVEVFFNGVELGNGYWELSDASEQLRRFNQEITERHDSGLPDVKLDERLLAAMQHGLPDCSGMAIGLDRLLMLLSNQKSIANVLAFPLLNA